MAKVLEFKAEYGISMEVKGVWHKLHSGITLEMEPGDDVAVVKEKAWNTVVLEVEQQLKTIIENS